MGRGVVCAACSLGLAGCGDEPVSDPHARRRPDGAAACEQLPRRPARQSWRASSRARSPAGALGAAWGDPAMVLTCGGRLPDDFDRFSQCVEANGVGWFVPADAQADQSATATLTAAGYRPVVR